jgi:hypothetical protein
MPKKKEYGWLLREHRELFDELFIKTGEICINQPETLREESTNLERDPDEEVFGEGGGSAEPDYAVDETESSVCYVSSLGYLSLIHVQRHNDDCHQQENNRATRGGGAPILLDAALEPRLHSLLQSIRNSSFCVENRHEPKIGSEEADQLFNNDDELRRQAYSKLKGKSIYYLFLEEQSRKCVLCGAKKTSTTRAVSCVRSHINHRPYGCPGIKGSCRKCNPQRG